MLKPAVARQPDQESGTGKKSPRGDNRAGLFFAFDFPIQDIIFRILVMQKEAGRNVAGISVDLGKFLVDRSRFFAQVTMNAC